VLLFVHDQVCSRSVHHSLLWCFIIADYDEPCDCLLGHTQRATLNSNDVMLVAVLLTEPPPPPRVHACSQHAVLH
jgi:hypothetical protein